MKQGAAVCGSDFLDSFRGNSTLQAVKSQKFLAFLIEDLEETYASAEIFELEAFAFSLRDYRASEGQTRLLHDAARLAKTWSSSDLEGNVIPVSDANENPVISEGRGGLRDWLSRI